MLTPNLNNSLILNGIRKPLIHNIVYRRGDAMYDNFHLWINSINSGLDDGARLIRSLKSSWGEIDGLEVATSVNATPTLSGTNLNVSLSEVLDFRLTDVIMDTKTRMKGTIINIVGNIVTLEPATSTAFNAAVHFQDGVGVESGSNAQVTRSSGGRTTLSRAPELQFNYPQILRESANHYRADFEQDWLSWEPGLDNWTASSFDDCVTRFANQEAWTAYYGDRYIQNEGAANERRYTGGIRYFVKNFNPELFLSLPTKITKDIFDDFIFNYVRKTGVTGFKLKCFTGADGLKTFQKDIAGPQIQAVGSRNTFGVGPESGYDSFIYAIGGFQVEVIHAKFFDRPGARKGAPSVIPGYANIESSTMLFVSDEPVWDSSKSMMLPSIVKEYYGMQGGKEFIAGFIPGMIDYSGAELTPAGHPNAVASSMMTNALPEGAFVTDLDALSFQIMTARNYRIFPDRFGIIETSN